MDIRGHGGSAGQGGGRRESGTLIHSLSPPTSHLPRPSWWRVFPSQGWVDGDSRLYPFLGGSGSLHSTPPRPSLGKCISYSVCNVDPSHGCGAGGWGRGAVGGGLLCRGVGLGGNCIDFSSQAGRCGAERPSPEPAQHTHWGGWRSRDRPTDRRTLLRRNLPCVLVPR